MFRKMRRSGQEISAEECRELLRTEKRAVLSVIGEEGYPYSVPISFFYDEAEGEIYFHGAKEGHKLDAIRRCDKVCFTTWEQGYLPEGDWAYCVRSVIVRGRAELVDDPAVTEEKVRRLGLKYYPSAGEVEEEIRSAIGRVQLIGLKIEHMSGKKIHEK